jgi:hypothetical protein
MKTIDLVTRAAVISGLLALLSLAAMAQDIRYNYMPGTNFAKYKTYKWVEVPGAKTPDQILDAQIKEAIDSQLTTKGLSKVADGDADLLVTYQVAIDQQREWNAYGGGGFRLGMGNATATSSTINIGTLILDFYDAAAKQQVWTGTATKQLNPKKDPAKNQANLQKAMAKLLKNYPPPAK